MKRPRYKRQERARLHKRIRELLKDGLTVKGVTEVLSREGFLHPTGAMLKPQNINAQIVQFKLRRTRTVTPKSEVTVTVQTPKVLSTEKEAFIDLLLESAELGDKTKLEMIRLLRKSTEGKRA